MLRLRHNANGPFWNQGQGWNDSGDGIEILSPSPAITRRVALDGKTNNLSYVLRISYAGISVILGGDAEEDAWDEIAARYGVTLKCDVLKASHHGRDSGYHQQAVELMSPQFTIVSVGKKPETDASNKYRQYTAKGVVSTRWLGRITLVIQPDGRGWLEYENAERASAAA